MYKSALTLIFTSFGASGAQFLAGVLIARLLGATGRGEYALFLLWAQFFGTFGVCGLDIALARRAADKRISGAWVMKTMLVVGCALAIAAVVVGVIASSILIPADAPPSKKALWVVMALFVPTSIYSAISQAVLLGRARFKLFSIVRMASPIALVTCACAAAVIMPATPWTLALAACAANLVTMVVGLVAVAVSQGEGTQSGRAGMTSEMVGFLGQLAIETVLASLPAILVAKITSMESLGHFTIAVTATSAVTLAIQPLSKLLFSRVASQASAGEDSTALAATGFRLAAIGILLSGLVLGPGLPILVPLVFGKPFIAAGLLSAALLPATLLTSLASFLDEALRARGAAKIGLTARAATLVTLAAAGYGFGVLWGAYGVAFGMAIAAGVRLAALLLGSRSVLKAPLRTFVPTAGDVRYLVASAASEIEKRRARRPAN